MKAAIKKYDVYRDSGAEWLGDVPAHWEVRRMKDFVAVSPPLKIPHSLLNDELVEFVPMTNVDEGLGIIKQFNFMPLQDVANGYTRFQNGDVIFAKITPCMENGNCALVSGLKHNIGFGSTEFFVFRSYRFLMSVYLHYFLHNELFRKNAEPFMKGSAGQKRVPRLYMSTHTFPCPPLDEQRAIAAYLDEKTAQIDHKIDLLTQKAAQYAQLKQSLINQTVTRGLDKTAPMKDSGIEWLGEIPAHWEVKRVNDIATRQRKKNDGLVERNLLSLSYGKIIRKDFNTSFGLLPASFETYQIVDKGNIILRLTDLQNDWTSLRVGLVIERGIITSAYLCLRLSRSIYAPFAYYLLHVYDVLKVFYRLGGGLRQSMKWEDIKILPFALPPFSEQKAIADYLDAKTAHIDRIIAILNRQIETLRELRKTLINDVVTGKIKIMDNG